MLDNGSFFSPSSAFINIQKVMCDFRELPRLYLFAVGLNGRKAVQAEGDAQELRFVVDRPPKWQYQGIAASERDSPSSFEGEPLIVRAEPPAAAPPEVAAPSTKARMDSVSTTPKAMSDLI